MEAYSRAGKSDARKAKEHLARAKAYFQRHEVLRSMEETAAALEEMARGVSAADRLHLEPALRELFQLLNRTEELRSAFPKGIGYRPGVEQPLHSAFCALIRRIQAAKDRESYEETLARKQKLDKLLGYGKKLLEAGKVQDADSAFQEATALYVDEHSLFRIMGEASMNAGQARMAARYLKRAFKIENQSAEIGALLVRALEQSGNIPAARKLEAELTAQAKAGHTGS